MDITCVAQTEDVLGEGVIWNPAERRLYWVDAYGPMIRRYDPNTGDVQSWKMPEIIGSLVFDRTGGIVAGLQSGFCRVSLDPVAVEQVVNPQPGPDVIFNDGKCDRRGRYLVGTMDRNFAPGAGVLWRLDPDWSTHRLDDGITVSNGLAWSPDDETMYFADTRALMVYAYDYDVETGNVDNKRIFFRTDDMIGRVDGATVDRDGNYWCAMIHDGSICCFGPKGRLERRIELPVKHPTMCTFGGPDLDVLYVATSRRFLDEAALRGQPLAGGLFAVTGTGAKGLAEPFFAGA